MPISIQAISIEEYLTWLNSLSLLLLLKNSKNKLISYLKSNNSQHQLSTQQECTNNNLNNKNNKFKNDNLHLYYAYLIEMNLIKLMNSFFIGCMIFMAFSVVLQLFNLCFIFILYNSPDFLNYITCWATNPNNSNSSQPLDIGVTVYVGDKPEIVPITVVSTTPVTDSSSSGPSTVTGIRSDHQIVNVD